MKAVLFIHGLSAKKEDNEYFIEEMKKYKNIDIFTFTLPGHEFDEVKKATRNDWINKSEEELKKILLKYNKVVVVAHSMGTIIAINLASRYKEIEKLVLLSSAFIFGNFKQNFYDLKNLLTHHVDKQIGTGFEGSLKKFIEVPKSVMVEYVKLAKENRCLLENIKCPTLIMHGDKDNVISIDSSKYVYDNLKCEKYFVTIKNVRHQIFKSLKKEEITEYIYKFITSNIVCEMDKEQEI